MCEGDPGVRETDGVASDLDLVIDRVAPVFENDVKELLGEKAYLPVSDSDGMMDAERDLVSLLQLDEGLAVAVIECVCDWLTDQLAELDGVGDCDSAEYVDERDGDDDRVGLNEVESVTDPFDSESV